MEKVIKYTNCGQQLKCETFTDGSVVYSVRLPKLESDGLIGDIVTFQCDSLQSATKLYNLLKDHVLDMEID